MLEMVEKVAVKKRLALLGQTQRVVELGARLARHQAAQKLHIGAGDFHVHHEIRTRKAEQHLQIVFAKQRRVDVELLRIVVQNGERKRHFMKAVDDLAHHIGALVAEEQAGEHLDLEVGAQAHLVQTPLHGREHVADISGQVFKLTLQLEVFHDAQHGVEQIFTRRIVRPVGRTGLGLFVLDVFGADRRAHKDEIVVKVRAVQDAAGDRVKEGLGQFGLVVVDQQTNVVELDLVPHVHRKAAGLEFLFQSLRAFLDAQVIELDPLTLGTLLTVPVGCFEAVFGARGFGTEQAVVPVEPVHHRLRDVVGLGRIEALGKHGLGVL